MPTTQNNPANIDSIDRPDCTAFGSRMWLSRVSPSVKGNEFRTFECPVCEVGAAPKAPAPQAPAPTG